MIIRIKRIWVAALAAAVAVMLIWLLAVKLVPASRIYMGTFVHAAGHLDEKGQFMGGGAHEIDERFHRPSKEKGLKLKYSFDEFEGQGLEEFLKRAFQSGRDVVDAYFAAVKGASNLEGYTGGCGTVGDAGLPYPFAYALLTDRAKSEISFRRFMDSFRGVGHITLLKVMPAFKPEGTPEDIDYLAVEIEVIAGFPKREGAFNKATTYFAYYYGIVTVKREEGRGWKIDRIDLIPEDFLCAPYHGWAYLAEGLVGIVFGERYGLIDKIDAVEQKGDMVTVYASKGDDRFRFVFVRLANGHDVLLHECFYRDGKWVEASFLKPEDQVFKLSILNPQIRGLV